ncbi:Hypothetical protein POVR2_LOCUS281 [uncultured virus]|nr:Hypothetical protein POVR2_LOCUS281 [uncultured virus]
MNRDILSIVASKLDDESLQTFWLHGGSQDDLRQLLTSNLFWYARCEHLAARVLQQRDQADWKRIYYILLLIVQEQEAEVTSVHEHALDYYEGMLVIEELYGPICVDKTSFSTTDAKLLERFVNEAPVDLQTFYWHVFECQLRANSPALEYLMSIVPEGLSQSDMSYVLYSALEAERADLLLFIVKYASQVSNPSRLLTLVATKDYIAGWQCVLQYYPVGDNELIACIADHDSIKIFTEYYSNEGKLRLGQAELDYMLDTSSDLNSKLFKSLDLGK